tara:strand:+ start:1050 stop:1331 length:282 start_codon:yes stop_codon:yes gene_type:complete
MVINSQEYLNMSRIKDLVIEELENREELAGLLEESEDLKKKLKLIQSELRASTKNINTLLKRIRNNEKCADAKVFADAIQEHVDGLTDVNELT